MNHKILCATLLLSLPACASRGHVSQSSVEPALTPFVVSTLADTMFALVGEFRGTYRVTPDSVIVLIESATIRNRPRPNGLDFTRDIGWVGLRYARYTTPPHWNAFGPPVPIMFKNTLPVGQELTLPPSRVAMPRPLDGPLSQYWLIVEFQDATKIPQHPTSGPGFAFAHFDHTMFANVR